MVTKCSSQGCTSPPEESLVLKGQPGHVHDCKRHAAELREHCDVIGSRPILQFMGLDPAKENPTGEDIVMGRHCQYRPCTGDAYIAIMEPTPL